MEDNWAGGRHYYYTYLLVVILCGCPTMFVQFHSLFSSDVWFVQSDTGVYVNSFG